jgi:hypothetical protein
MYECVCTVISLDKCVFFTLKPIKFQFFQSLSGLKGGLSALRGHKLKISVKSRDRKRRLTAVKGIEREDSVHSEGMKYSQKGIKRELRALKVYEIPVIKDRSPVKRTEIDELCDALSALHLDKMDIDEETWEDKMDID